MADLILRGGSVIDGTGSPRFRGDVVVVGDRIVGVGDVSKMAGAREIDVSGKIVAPGFIDVHTHDDRALFAAIEPVMGPNTLVYAESGRPVTPLPPLRVLRQARAGGVHYHLLARNALAAHP